jgi:hypothetical protein
VKHPVGMDSGAMMYIPNLINFDSGIQKLIGEGDSETRREHGDLISVLLFFK